MKESDSIMQAFAQSRELAPESEEVQALVAKWQDFISARYYTCTDEILEAWTDVHSRRTFYGEHRPFRRRNGGADVESDCLLCEPQKKQRINSLKYKTKYR